SLPASSNVRFPAVATDYSFQKPTPAGYTWEALPVREDGRKPVRIAFHPENPNFLFAVTTKGAYRSADFGEKFLGETWESLTDGLPPADKADYAVALAPGHPGRIYARLDGELFTRRLDEGDWRRGGVLGFGRYARTYDWIAVDPSNPDHAFTGVKTEYSGAGT